ncbi:hypothetical protein HAX54_027617, partial [Datura stramonium]|nr:hypothetical protein [Datura stramonium]
FASACSRFTYQLQLKKSVLWVTSVFEPVARWCLSADSRSATTDGQKVLDHFGASTGGSPELIYGPPAVPLVSPVPIRGMSLCRRCSFHSGPVASVFQLAFCQLHPVEHWSHPVKLQSSS